MGVIRHARHAQVTKSQDLWKELSYFAYLLHVVTNPWELQRCHPVLARYSMICPKFSEITKCQYPWKDLSDFVDFLHVVICILLDIHRTYKNMQFWAGNVRHGLSAIQIARYFKPKKLENYMRFQVDFLHAVRQLMKL